VRIAVVIVNWNGGLYLPRALRALLAQRRRADRILVIDNASTDGSTAAVADFPGVELLPLSSNTGFAAANNTAAAEATDCEWLAFLNPDAFPAPDWLERLLDAAESWPDYAMFASELRLEADPERYDGAGDAYHVSGLPWRIAYGRRLGAVPTTPHEVFSPCAAAALIRRDAFDDAGGFDTSYFCYMEDVDLAFRMRLRGHRCLYVPGAIVDHVGSGLTGRHSAFSVYHGHRNLVWTWIKNMPGWWLLVYLPQHVVLTLASIARFGASGNLGAILRAKRDALAGLRSALAERRRVQRRRTVPSRDVIAAMKHGWLAPYREHWERARVTSKTRE
jgi:GT2 family glycosyltransferase